MNNYQQLQKNLHELKLTQISLQIDDYINKINEHKLSIVDALCELTSKEVEVKNFNAAHAMVKVAAFPHLKELKDFDFEFQPKINKQQFLDFESLRFLVQFPLASYPDPDALHLLYGNIPGSQDILESA